MKYAEIVYVTADALYKQFVGRASGFSGDQWDSCMQQHVIVTLQKTATVLRAAGIDISPPKTETVEEKIARIEQRAIEWDRRMDAYEARLSKLEPVDEGFRTAPGYMPVELGNNTIVEVRFRDGTTDIDKAGLYGWEVEGTRCDIMSFRRVKDA